MNTKFCINSKNKFFVSIYEVELILCKLIIKYFDTYKLYNF